MTPHDPLKIFRDMLDQNNWPGPMKKGEYIIVQGEVFCFLTRDPLEERVYKPLFRKFQ